MSVLRALSFVGAMALLPGANAMAQPAPPPPPLLGLPDGFLAEGPLPITVMISADVTSARAKKTEKGSLVLLTAKKLLYYADGNKTLQKHLASPVAGNVFLIETGDERKLKWKVDPETKLFTGEHVLPAPLLVKLPRKITPAQESLYLYFALEHLHGRVDEALSGGNEGAVDLLLPLQASAKRVAKRIKAKQLSDDVYELYACVSEYIAEQQKLIGEAGTVAAEDKDRADQLKRKKKVGALVYQQNATGSFLLPLYGTAEANKRMVIAGLGGTAESNQRYLREQLELKQAEQCLQKETYEEVAAIEEERQQSREDRDRRMRTLARTLDLPEDGLQEDLVNQARANRDYEPLAKHLLDIAKKSPRNGELGNPWQWVDACLLSSPDFGAKDAARAEKGFDLAKLCVSAAGAVPPDEFYNPDRGNPLDCRPACTADSSGRTRQWDLQRRLQSKGIVCVSCVRSGGLVWRRRRRRRVSRATHVGLGPRRTAR